MTDRRVIHYRRAAIVLCTATAAGGGIYAAYRVYNSDYVKQQRQRLQEAWVLFTRLHDALFTASELSTIVLNDLRAFVSSDSNEVPRSVRQILKLSSSEEFQHALVRTSYSITEGALRGGSLSTALSHPEDAPYVTLPKVSSASSSRDGSGNGLTVRRTGLVETVLDKLFTEQGKSFATAVVGKATRTLVSSLAEKLGGAGRTAAGGADGAGVVSAADGGRGGGASPQFSGWELLLVELASSAKGKALITQVVATFAVNAVGTFIEKTGNVNVYDDILSAVSRHRELVKDVGSHILTRTAETVVGTAMAPRPPPQAYRPTGAAAAAAAAAGVSRVGQDVPVDVSGGLSPSDRSPSSSSLPGSEAPSPSESLSPRSRTSLDSQSQDAMWQGVTEAETSTAGCSSSSGLGGASAMPARVASSSATVLHSKLTTYFRALSPPFLPASPLLNQSAADPPAGASAPATWQRQVALLLADKDMRSLVLELAGTVSARSMRAFVLVLFHSLFASEPVQTSQHSAAAASQFAAGGSGRAELHLVEGDERELEEEGGSSGLRVGGANVALSSDAAARVAGVCSRQARVCAGQALTVASCCLALVMHCMLGYAAMSAP